MYLFIQIMCEYKDQKKHDDIRIYIHAERDPISPKGGHKYGVDTDFITLPIQEFVITPSKLPRICGSLPPFPQLFEFVCTFTLII